MQLKNLSFIFAENNFKKIVSNIFSASPIYVQKTRRPIPQVINSLVRLNLELLTQQN